MAKTRPKKVKSKISKSHEILACTIESVSAFSTVFDILRKQKRGTTHDYEQDMLRSMLIFACAGLDSLLKQIVKDGLEDLVNKTPIIKDNFKDFVNKLMKKVDTDEHRKFMVEVLTDNNPKNVALEIRKKHIIRGSLQSIDQINQIHGIFDVKLDKGHSDILTPAFKARNEIIHEMDIAFAKRTRRQRKKADIEKRTSVIFVVAKNFIKEIDKKLS